MRTRRTSYPPIHPFWYPSTQNAQPQLLIYYTIDITLKNHHVRGRKANHTCCRTSQGGREHCRIRPSRKFKRLDVCRFGRHWKGFEPMEFGSMVLVEYASSSTITAHSSKEFGNECHPISREGGPTIRFLNRTFFDLSRWEFKFWTFPHQCFLLKTLLLTFEMELISFHLIWFDVLHYPSMLYDTWNERKISIDSSIAIQKWHNNTETKRSDQNFWKMNTICRIK